MKCISIEVSNKIWNENPAQFNWDKMVEDMVNIFANNPKHYIHIDCGNEYKVKDEPYLGMWSMTVPKYAWIQLKTQLEGKVGYIRENRGRNGQLHSLYVSLV